MLFLLLRILFNTAFSQLLKYAQARDGQMLPAALVNYAVAAVIGAGAVVVTRAHAPAAVSLWLGVATGVFYAVSMLGLETAIRVCGVSIAVALNQLSVLVPTVCSILFFHERPNAAQAMGIVAATVALPLLSRSRASAERVRIGVRELALAIFLVFFVTGLSGLTMKMFDEMAPHRDVMPFTTAVFAVATLVIAVALWVRRVPWGRAALPAGTLIGLSNILQLEATMQALAIIKAVIVFPVTSALTVALNAGLAMVFWRERLDRAAQVGIALAILSAVLLNL